MMTTTDIQHSTEVRAHLIRALEADLVGPFHLDDPDKEEVLPLPPSRWYLTGFLAPEGNRELQDPTQEEDLGAGSDEDEEESVGQEPEPKQKKFLPASIGLSVLLLPVEHDETFTATVQYADYVLEKSRPDGAKHVSRLWVRMPRAPKTMDVPLDAAILKNGIPIPGSGGIVLTGHLAGAEAPGLAPGTRALSLFVVNRREPSENRREQDEQFIFQVSLTLSFKTGFVPRTNRQGEQSDEWDERVSDLQFRDYCEYAVGHGVSVEVPAQEGPVSIVRTAWIPKAEVRRVVTHEEPGVETRMGALAELTTADQVDAALAALPHAYGAWLDRQAGIPLETDERQETRDQLVHQAQHAKARIEAGIQLLKENPQVLRAFCLTNRAMAMAAGKRNPERYEKGNEPQWRLFQLAFLLLNVCGIVDPTHDDRETVELIFFPTGGGKTEAYLGVIAMTIIMRRLQRRDRPDKGLGVAVLLRYTLRLLTLDQLGRAATLICALEMLRKAMPEQLGEGRFAVGLWVGKSATANTMREVSKEITDYKNSPSAKAPSPFPLPICPWCGTPLNRDSLTLLPSPTKPQEVIVGCTNFRCDFAAGKNRAGLPVLFVDEQIYRELPAFIVATVDKFAMLPWRGETGMLFGRVTGLSDGRFFGPMDEKLRPYTPLPEGLLPPELIVQDELHLIAGPLGTMVGLYETAVEALCMREDPAGGPVKPKIIAATATVRRASRQIQALFGRNETALFPPPGVDASQTFFAKIDEMSPGRRYIGVAASGRALKAILIRTYVSLLSAAQKLYVENSPIDQPADPYMTLAGYFNSLRELGGMRRLVEDDVSTLCMKRDERVPYNIHENPWYAVRKVREPVELTSRESTGKIADTRRRLSDAHQMKESVDVLLASNMISVGIDIDRLGLMVVAGQPKTSSEYIQATSRVGRNPKWPGLVVTCFNLHKPRDRSHYERFTAYHDTFYRFVEVMSLTPFSGQALERGLAGAFVAMTRLLDQGMTPPLGVMEIEDHLETAEQVIQQISARGAAQPGAGDSQSSMLESLTENLSKRSRSLLDAWIKIASKARTSDGAKRGYSRFDSHYGTKALLYMMLDENKPEAGSDEEKFCAPTSMREVEPVTHLWVQRGRLGGKSND